MAKNMYQQMRDNVIITVGTLGAKSVAKAQSSNIDAGTKQGFRLMRAEVIAVALGITVTEAPLLFGIASGMSSAEIAECIEARPQYGGEPKGTAAVANRPVWILGSFNALVNNHNPLNDGNPVVVQPKWSFIEGVDMQYFVYNATASTMTTGATINVTSTLKGVWLAD